MSHLTRLLYSLYGRLDRANDHGQGTVEYALVVLAAATIGMLALAWASRTGTIDGLLNQIMARVSSGAG